VGPARIVTESLTPDPELENSQGQEHASSCCFRTGEFTPDSGHQRSTLIALIASVSARPESLRAGTRRRPRSLILNITSTRPLARDPMS
jgi:hypothetical protein